MTDRIAPKPPSSPADKPTRPKAHTAIEVRLGAGRLEVVTIDPLEASRWQRELASVRALLGVV